MELTKDEIKKVIHDAIIEASAKPSLSLITLTEERLRGVIVQAYHDGFDVGRWSDDMESYPYASRIIEALKKDGT